MNRLALSLILTLLTAVAARADVALILGNADYVELRNLRGGGNVLEASEALEDLGFELFAQEDAASEDLQELFGAFAEAAEGSERVLVILSGRFLHSSRDAWLLPVDADAVPQLEDLPGQALPLSLVLAVLAEHPGKALLLLGEDDGAGAAGGAYLSLGPGRLDLPQGVTLLRGAPRAMGGFAEDVLPLPAMARTVAAARQQGLQVEGFAPEDYRFFADEPPTAQPDDTPADDEDAAWRAAQAVGAIAAYRDYIRRFPDGPNVAEAQSRIAAIEAEPNRSARLAEEALGLTPDERRTIQRNLSILDFDPRGIDGLIGPASRAAIGRWQTANGAPATGYVTREQIGRIQAQAARRAAELEAEAEARRLEQEREDRAYWAATGAAGDEPGLRSYLKRYPDGVFAEVAQDRLAIFEERNRAAAAQADRAAWDSAVSGGTIASYTAYLDDNPKGAFAEEARARIDDLSRESNNEQANQTARQGEEALRLTPQTRSLIEGRLAALGLKPGRVDGNFDKSTRRAIRRYQEARDLPVTGFLSQQTVVRIMADSILR